MLADRRLRAGFLSFLLLGMPYAALGVAWPSMASDTGRSLGDLGFVLVATTAGYVTATAANGWLTHRFGTGVILPAAGMIAAVSLLGFATATSLLPLVASSVVLGSAGGAIDAGINSHVAVIGSTRVMGWLHAVFGIGSTIGPLVTTELLAADISWRAAFWILAGAQGGVTILFVTVRHRWPERSPRSEAAPRLPRAKWTVMAMSLVAFAMYTGIEVAAGDWSFSLFTEGRDIGTRTAGYLVSGYWAALTVGRIAMGVAGDRISQRTLLLGSLIGTAAAALIFAWSPSAWVGSAGLLLTGLFLAPIFPVLVLVTSESLGHAYAPWAVGYQIAAAGIGAALIPGAIGALVGSRGIDVAGPLTATGAVALLAAGLTVLVLDRRGKPINPTTPQPT